jgi:hypothetical protein
VTGAARGSKASNSLDIFIASTLSVCVRDNRHSYADSTYVYLPAERCCLQGYTRGNTCMGSGLMEGVRYVRLLTEEWEQLEWWALVEVRVAGTV